MTAVGWSVRALSRSHGHEGCELGVGPSLPKIGTYENHSGSVNGVGSSGLFIRSSVNSKSQVTVWITWLGSRAGIAREFRQAKVTEERKLQTPQATQERRGTSALCRRSFQDIDPTVPDSVMRVMRV